jgi:hypothetical protein
MIMLLIFFTNWNVDGQGYRQDQHEARHKPDSRLISGSLMSSYYIQYSEPTEALPYRQDLTLAVIATKVVARDEPHVHRGTNSGNSPRRPLCYQLVVLLGCALNLQRPLVCASSDGDCEENP